MSTMAPTESLGLFVAFLSLAACSGAPNPVLELHLAHDASDSPADVGPPEAAEHAPDGGTDRASTGDSGADAGDGGSTDAAENVVVEAGMYPGCIIEGQEMSPKYPGAHCDLGRGGIGLFVYCPTPPSPSGCALIGDSPAMWPDVFCCPAPWCGDGGEIWRLDAGMCVP
jgi:hypothetical protein